MDGAPLITVASHTLGGLRQLERKGNMGKQGQ